MIALEHLADGSTADRNFQKLMSLVPDTGGQSLGIRIGTGTSVFTASATAANVVITHGLGRIPLVEFTTGRDFPFYGFAVTARSATTITVTGFTTNAAVVSVSRTFGWVVIG